MISGNTSTDVEKTQKQADHASAQEKHLHGRGEDLDFVLVVNWFEETPPRTWRRHRRAADHSRCLGNTSTDVEKTPAQAHSDRSIWKHLHGRGEDLISRSIFFLTAETPPRTWRRQVQEVAGMSSARNTSTDVEKTGSNAPRSTPGWKHLHGRGEDLGIRSAADCAPRNTSTDVEKT